MTESAPILGLVLAGGQSKRMGRDKASLLWQGEPLWLRQAKLLQGAGLPVAVSVRVGQTLPSAKWINFQLIPDQFADAGPLAGFLSAWSQYPTHALLAVACDLPLLDAETIHFLLQSRRADKQATAFNSANDGLPEPLCAIYEPAMHSVMQSSLEQGRRCPRKLLIEAGDQAELLALTKPTALENANTPDDLARLLTLAEAPA